MSEPETYALGQGTAAHNRAMSRLRAEADTAGPPDEPTRVWLDRDRTPEGVMRSLTIILNTGGCRWADEGGCTMCGYVAEATETVTEADLETQLEQALAYEAKEAHQRAPMVKIYTSGSALDDRELTPNFREHLAQRLSDRKRLVLESLPQFVDADRLEPFVSRAIDVDVAIGLETADDRIRRDCVNKLFSFADFERACETATAVGAGVKAYLLLKPPFLTEQEAIDDMVESVRACSTIDACHTVSMNPTNVQRYTMVDEQYFHSGYRPPWLWSVVAVLEATTDVDAIVTSDPVGAGSDRGPHNCGDCDERVERAIEDFSLRGDPSVFEQVDCACRQTWEAICEREHGYSQPLAK